MKFKTIIWHSRKHIYNATHYEFGDQKSKIKRERKIFEIWKASRFLSDGCLFDLAHKKKSQISLKFQMSLFLTWKCMRWLIGKILSSYFQTEAISVVAIHNANSFINGEKILKISFASLVKSEWNVKRGACQIYFKNVQKNCFIGKH